MRYTLILLILISVVLFSSCVTVNDGVDLFFMGENSLQYFFPSREWESLDDNLSLEADWLYRTYPLVNEDGGGRTILNLSLYSIANLYRTVPKRIVLSSDNIEIVIPPEQISLVYLDRGKTRYSSWLYSDSLDQLFLSITTKLNITLEFDTDLVFTSSAEFIPQIEYYHDVLLGISPNNKN